MILNGIDIADIGRIKKSMENPRFLEEYFSETEREYFRSVSFNPQSVAGAFCAKEAFSKAIGTGIRGFKLSDVSVCHDTLGKPYFKLYGEAARIAKKRKLNLTLSITHTDDIAAASVFGTGEPMYKTVIFDLDGTLLDTSGGVIKSVEFAFKKLNLPQPALAQAISFIGPPLYDSFVRTVGQEKAEKGVEYFREYYETLGGMFEARVYDGIEDVLKHLKSDGRILCVATLKLEEYARDVLEHFKIARYFDFINGMNVQGTATKAELVKRCLQLTGCAPDEAVLVGDSMYDCLGAQEAEVDFIGAGYGFSPKEGFPKDKTVCVCRNPLELVEHI